MRTLQNHGRAVLCGLLLIAGCEAPVSEEALAPDAMYALGLSGKADGVWSSCEVDRVLDLVNDSAVTVESLKVAGVHTRAARNIVAFRAGADGALNTGDDQEILDLHALDAIPYVGPVALQQLLAIVAGGCLAAAELPQDIDVIFSPQPYLDSHLMRVRALLDSAERSLDIAMYSLRDGGVLQSLEAAAARGVSVRLIFDKASKHKKSPEGTRSASLEEAGIDVRYVNKTMHHKFVLVDGPRLDLGDASDAVLLTGSGNWSWSAGTRYDENTLEVMGNPRLVLLFQREFNYLWDNARDFVWNQDLAPAPEVTPVEAADLPFDPYADAAFTSANFDTGLSSVHGPTFSIVAGRSEVATRLVALIEGAEESIELASSHLRLRPVSEALMAKAVSAPQVDIRVLLDGQEYTSAWRQGKQHDKVAACEEAAPNELKASQCKDVGYYFARDLDDAGVPVRFKWNAFRWHYLTAEQMHHKYMIIDRALLVTGSYNLSHNAEHKTFENIVLLDGAMYPQVVDAFRMNFENIWELGVEEGMAQDLLEDVLDGSGPVPLIFEPMSLSTLQIDVLKAAIREACPPVDQDPAFHANPEKHKVCHP